MLKGHGITKLQIIYYNIVSFKSTKEKLHGKMEELLKKMASSIHMAG